MIKRKNGANKISYFKKKASTAILAGALVYIDSDGYLNPASASSTNHIGVCLETIASTDADYSSTRKVMVDIGNPTDIFTAEVSAGTVAQTAVGAYYDLNSTGDKVDLSATSVKAVYVVDMNTAAGTVDIQINSLASVDETGA
jgi:hypothetical protein